MQKHTKSGKNSKSVVSGQTVPSPPPSQLSEAESTAGGYAGHPSLQLGRGLSAQEEQHFLSCLHCTYVTGEYNQDVGATFCSTPTCGMDCT